MPADRRGYALLLALLVLVVTIAAMGLVAGGLRLHDRELHHASRGVHLRALTDAALAIALDAFSLSAGWTGVTDFPVGEGTVDVAIGPSSNPRWRIVTVTGRYRGGVRSIEAAVAVDDPPLIGAWRRVTVAGQTAPR